MIVRVSAASRLHFGLLHVPVPGIAHDETVRKYGGLGLMVDRPGVTVEVSLANDWHFEGSLAERAKRFVQIMFPDRPFSVIANGPPEHVGLGVGTALGMALADAVSTLEGNPNRTVNELAEMCGRGERSGIGVSGFRSGGLIVDPGKRDGELLSDCLSVPFPDEWRIVIARPAVRAPWSGESERAAFARPRSLTDSLRTKSRLEGLLIESILPTLSMRDFDRFSKSLTRFNRIAGEPFVADQGGDYSSPDMAEVVEVFRKLGVVGVGQSSWGPTAFAVTVSEVDAAAIVDRVRLVRPDLQAVEVARVAGPAHVEVLN